MMTGTISTASTITAVASLSAFGSRPARIAAATTSRKTTAPLTAPAIQRPTVRLPVSTSPIMSVATPMTAVPVPIWMLAKPWNWAKVTPASAINPFDRPSAEGHRVHVDAGCPRHLGVVSRSAHREPKIGAQEGRQANGKCDGQQAHEDEAGDARAAHRIATDGEAGGQAEQVLAEALSLVEDAVRRAERKIAAAHDKQGDGVEGGAGEDTGEQRTDLEAGLQDRGDRPRADAGGGTDDGGRKGWHAPHQERRDHGRAQTERPIGGEVEGAEQAKGDEHAQRQRREDETDGDRADKQVHGTPQATWVMGAIQPTPRAKLLSGTASVARSSHTRWRTSSSR